MVSSPSEALAKAIASRKERPVSSPSPSSLAVVTVKVPNTPA